MATDPEARASSNSGVLIAVVALVLVIGLAVAFMSMRGNEPGDTTIVNPPSSSETTVIEAPDAPKPPDVNVEVAPPSSSTTTTTTVESAPPAADATPPAGEGD